MNQPFYVKLPSPFGTFAVVWLEADGAPSIQQVLLAREGASGEKRARAAFTGLRKGVHPRIEEVAAGIQRFLEGEALSFELDLVDFGRCSPFQRRVILAEHGIPRGMVSTYGRIARHLDTPGAARAVGSALARNPFPIIIPCHRAVLSDGRLGGYQGGTAMKRALLESEGVAVSESGKVLTEEFYY